MTDDVEVDKARDDYYFRCTTCGHDAFTHFKAFGGCFEVGCECERFLSQLHLEEMGIRED